MTELATTITKLYEAGADYESVLPRAGLRGRTHGDGDARPG